MKKIITLVLIYMFIGNIVPAMAQDAFSEYYLEKNEVLYSKSSRSINAIDPKMDETKKGTYYPGFRGANQLIVYTKAYGDKTGTNEFGAEAIVKDNIVAVKKEFL